MNRRPIVRLKATRGRSESWNSVAVLRTAELLDQPSHVEARQMHPRLACMAVHFDSRHELPLWQPITYSIPDPDSTFKSAREWRVSRRMGRTLQGCCFGYEDQKQ